MNAASGHAVSPPRLNRTLPRILAFFCMLCGLVAAYFGFMTGMFVAGLAAMMRDPSLGWLMLVFPLAAILPFFILSFFLYRARPWARIAFVVLLTLGLVPIAQILGSELAFKNTGVSDFSISFTLLAGVLVLSITPWTRKAFGQRAGLWWLEALLAALPVLLVFSSSTRSTASILAQVEADGQQLERDGAELTRLLQAPESSETDARINELISGNAAGYTTGINEMSPLVLAAKNHPHVFKALLDDGAKPLEPIVWKYLAEGGHYDLLPEVVRRGIRPDPQVAEQLGIELIRMIGEDRNDPGYRERVTGLIHGGADLTVMDQGRTALEEAMRSEQTEIEDLLREQMKLPARGR